MDELEQQLLIHQLKKSSFSRILFITIRDPNQSSVWCKIGKVNDWIRKYTKNYYIVMSPLGGIHFHLICDVPVGTIPKPVKCIHFYIASLGDGEVIPSIPTSEERDDNLKAEHFRLHNHMINIIKLQVPPLCTQLSTMIRKYWTKTAAKLKRVKASDKKTRKILSILLYLQQNLYEDRDDTYAPVQYFDYIYKCQLKAFPTQGHQTPLVSGIADLTIGQ